MNFLSSAIMLIVGLYLTLITAPALAAGSICGSSQAASTYWYADGKYLNPSAYMTSPVPFDHDTYIVSLGDIEYGSEYTDCSFTSSVKVYLPGSSGYQFLSMGRKYSMRSGGGSDILVRRPEGPIRCTFIQCSGANNVRLPIDFVKEDGSQKIRVYLDAKMEIRDRPTSVQLYDATWQIQGEVGKYHSLEKKQIMSVSTGPLGSGAAINFKIPMCTAQGVNVKLQWNEYSDGSGKKGEMQIDNCMLTGDLPSRYQLMGLYLSGKAISRKVVTGSISLIGEVELK